MTRALMKTLRIDLWLGASVFLFTYDHPVAGCITATLALIIFISLAFE